MTRGSDTQKKTRIREHIFTSSRITNDFHTHKHDRFRESNMYFIGKGRFDINDSIQGYILVTNISISDFKLLFLSPITNETENFKKKRRTKTLVTNSEGREPLNLIKKIFELAWTQVGLLKFQHTQYRGVSCLVSDDAT